MRTHAADAPAPRHALVTGGAGFIGSHLVDLLLGEGWRVTVVDNFDPFYHPSVKWENVAAHVKHPGYTLTPVDLRDETGLEGQLDDHYDVVVHLAAKAGVRPSIADPLAYQDVNVRGTQNLLEFCRRRAIEHFVFASSSSVYGVNPNVPWSEEDHGLMPISPYASTKVSGELLGHVYSRLFGIRFTALRFFTAYGPRQRPDLAIHKFARLMMARRPIPMFGDGSMRRDYTYVGDVVKGVRAAMDYTASQYEIINLGNSCTVSLRELIGALEEVLGVDAVVEQHPEQPGDVPQTWANTDKAMRLLGFRPNTPLREGLTRFAMWASETWFGEGISAPRSAAPVFRYEEPPRTATSSGI
ncbi:MAG TPA: NAD-dependent epimerase/dehydratase family protein [Gemmatimonadaceae bacterium]